MKTQLKLSQSKDIIINPMIQEELLIKSLVEEIYNAEEKISQINNSKENVQNGLTLNNQKIFELKSLQNNLERKLFALNNNYESEISSYKNQILSQKNLLNDLDSSIKEYQNKLSKINTIDFKSPLLSKYALENDINNKILSQEQINEIYLKNKNRNENEIRQLVKEIEINKASESVIINNKNEINKKAEQIDENIKMLKEEKLSIKDELIDIISYKESLELINRNNIFNIIRILNLKSNIKEISKINNNINSNEEEDEAILQIENYLYEFTVIEPNNTANKLYEELSDLFRVIGSYNNKKNKNNSSYLINDINTLNNSKNSTNINFYINNKKKEMNTIDIFEDNSNYNNFNLNNKGKSLSNSCIGGLSGNNFTNNKNSMKFSVKEELKNFIKTINDGIFENYDNGGIPLIINDFLNKIAMIIINQLKNNENEINNYSDLQSELIVYLSYFFKIIYYEYIVENKFKFINKEYKTQKKEYKKIKEIINNEIVKLDNKYDEIKSKRSYNEKQLSILNKSNQNQTNDNYINLLPDEKSYIQICLKINSFIKQKEEIEKNINNYEIDISNKKIKNQNEINNIKNELEKINNEIDNINNLNEMHTLKNNENIIKYRKIIDDKFNAIKEQLKLYKEKYGSNLNLYNKFINDINITIQDTYNKSFFELGTNKNNFFNNCYNNGIIMIGTENKSNNNKYINLNMLGNLKNKNNSSNNITNSKLFSTDRKMEKSSINKSLNYNTKENNDIVKNVEKILNKTISNLKQSSDLNLSSNDICLDDKKNHNFINNIKIEKINRSFYQYSSLSNKNKKENKANSHKKRNTLNNFDLLNNNNKIFNNIFNKESILDERRKEKNNIKNNETNSKTFSHPFFRRQSKSQGGVPDTIPFPGQTKTTKNSVFNIGIHKGIPRGSKVNNENLKNEQNIKNSIKNIKIKLEKKSISNNNNNNNFLYKLNPLTKITFCYYREISSSNGIFVKYNPLKSISSKELCEYPYNFIKSTISLNRNFKSIKIVPSTQLEPIDIKISMVENTVVSSVVKSVIDIHRNYYKWKENNKGNNIINDFINEQMKKHENLNQEDIEKCIINKNFNFSIIIKSEEKENNNRFEFIICSYDEFKMWINGMAYIIKNKNNIIRLSNLYNQEKNDLYN